MKIWGRKGDSLMGNRRHEQPLNGFVEDMLSTIQSGSISISANGFPLTSVNAESRVVEVEAKGMKEAGLNARELLNAGRPGEAGLMRLLKESENLARVLFDRGWSLVVYDGGSRVLTMGTSAPSITGHVSANLLNLRRLFEDF